MCSYPYIDAQLLALIQGLLSMPGLWNEQGFWIVLRCVSQMWNSWALHEDKRVLTERSFHHLCIPPPLSYSFSMLLCDTALQKNDSSFCACDPIFEYFYLPCLKKCFLEVRWRKCQLPWSVVQDLWHTKHQTLQGGNPTLNWQRKLWSALAALYLIFLRKHIVNKRWKLEFGSEQRWIAACSSRPCLCELVWGWFWMWHEILLVIANKDFNLPLRANLDSVFWIYL